MRSPRGGEQRGQGEEIAGAGRAIGYQGEDLGYEALLYAGFELSVEFGQTRLALAVKDQDGVDHG